MAKHSGASHAAGAVAAIVVSELLADTVSAVVGEEGIEALVDVLVDLLSIEGVVYTREGTVEGLLLVLFVTALTFLWGYAYHVKRHG